MTNEINQNSLSRTKPFDLVETLKRHWLKIVVFGMALFFLFYPVAIFLSEPYYSTEGKLRVSPNIPSFITQTEENSITNNYTQYVNTQIARITGPKIIEKAIERLSPEIKKNFKPNNLSIDLAVNSVQRSLEVSEMPGTYLLSIKMTRDNQRGITDIINSIMDVFIEEYQNEEEGTYSRRLLYLSKEKERLELEIGKEADQLQKISNEINSSGLLVNTDMTAQFQTAYESAYKERVEKESILKAVIKEADALKALPVDADVNEIVGNNTSLSKIETLTQDSIHELRSTMLGMTEDNPERKQINKKINDIENYSEEKRNIITDNAKDLFIKKRESSLQEKIIKATSEFEAAKMTEEGMLKERNRLLTDIAKISPKTIDKQQTQDRLTQLSTFLTKIEDRINELQLESKSPGRFFIETRPKMPLGPSGTNFKKLIVLIFVFSFGGVTFICVVFDLLDDRIRSIKDVVNILGAAPYRPIPDYLLIGSENISFARVTLDDPSNEVSQSIHSLAIRLDKERKERDAKVAVFTGVDSKSGVTEILINTAHAISKLCSKVLIIEANFANPTLTLMNKEKKNQKGLIDILLRQADPFDCINHDKERDIDILFAGHFPNNEELANLDRSKIPVMIEGFKKKYEFILIDTIPILISDLTEFFLMQADIVPLVIQGDRSSSKHLNLASQALIKLEVPAIATVLNWGAPRYKTKIQKTVFQFIWPIQKHVNLIVSRCIHPIPSQPYSSTKKSEK